MIFRDPASLFRIYSKLYWKYEYWNSCPLYCFSANLITWTYVVQSVECLLDLLRLIWIRQLQYLGNSLELWDSITSSVLPSYSASRLKLIFIQINRSRPPERTETRFRWFFFQVNIDCNWSINIDSIQQAFFRLSWKRLLGC